MNHMIASLFSITLLGISTISAGIAAPADVTSMEEAAVREEVVSEGQAAVAAPAMEPVRATAATGGSVVRAVFTTMMRDREPMDDITKLGTDVGQVYFFTELGDMNGQRVTHRWQHNGDVMAEVSFDVRGSRWRVWSNKTLTPQLTGTWKVTVLDGSGGVVHEATFEYVARNSAAGQ
ncbi:MAG: hypothetical protein FD165_824 [Gammaproteobacteria bacterium]|nr:MAG: hypothetical protein FD165_824 [Gammaproteobacteria bacterium]TND06467.1 MAG: hypothetical protein FD120_954 [Gammaproteobacteria bacterium]